MEHDELLMNVQMKAIDLARQTKQATGAKNDYFITLTQLNDLLMQVLYEANNHPIDKE